MVQKEYIRFLHFREGESLRSIAKMTGLHRITVKKALEDSDPPKYHRTAPEFPPNRFFVSYDEVTEIGHQVRNINMLVMRLINEYSSGDIDEESLWQEIKDIPDELNELLDEIDTVNETLEKSYWTAVGDGKLVWHYLSSAGRNLSIATYHRHGETTTCEHSHTQQ